MIKNFALAVSPRLFFGPGQLSMLTAMAKSFGPKILLTTGARSFFSSAHAENLLEQFGDNLLVVEQHRIEKEPAPQTIDEAVRKFSAFAPDCVIAIGGGSVLDAGKAISAMLPLKEPVNDYLEGVGGKITSRIKNSFYRGSYDIGNGQ
jgi:alcohol dehydrogenase class IV